MDKKTYSTGDLIEIAALRAFGIEPDAVVAKATHWSRQYGIAFYEDADKIPPRESFSIVFVDKQGNARSVPLLTTMNTKTKSFASTFIESKREVFDAVSTEKTEEANGKNDASN